MIASGSLDGTARLWHPESGEALVTMHHKSKKDRNRSRSAQNMKGGGSRSRKRIPVTALRLHSWTQALVTGAEDGSVWPVCACGDPPTPLPTRCANSTPARCLVALAQDVGPRERLAPP